MAIISQISIFDNTEVYDNLGELERIKLILENIPDEKLLDALRKERDGKGREPDEPVEALLNIYWVKRIIEHPKMSQMLRELNRNSQLRKICGLQKDKAPSKYIMTRFMKKLKKQRKLIKEIFYINPQKAFKKILLKHLYKDTIILVRNKNDIKPYLSGEAKFLNEGIIYQSKFFPLYTIHSSKGLEADYVIILNVSNKN